MSIETEAVCNPWQLVIDSRFLASLLHEIENLQDKLHRSEAEGWEGSKRRVVLKGRVRQLLSETRPDER